MNRPRLAFIASGGASKGIAHLGALRALEELGLVPDIVIGSSVGAILGAFYTQGIRSEEMIDWLRPFWQRREPGSALKGRYFLGLPSLEELRAPGWLTSGLFSTGRLERFLRERLPRNDFRDLGRTLLVTAADIDRGTREVFGQGHREEVPISEAVAASCCVPILFRPMKIGDRYYIDGELVRTLSIDLAIDAGADVVIVSNVYRPFKNELGDGSDPKARSLALRGPGAVATQSLNIVLSEKEQRGIELLHQQSPNVSILTVSADIGRYSFFRRGASRTLLQRGYREALRVLAPAKERGLFRVRQNVHTVGHA